MSYQSRRLLCWFSFLLLIGFGVSTISSVENVRKPPAGLKMVPQLTPAEQVKLARRYIRTRNYTTAAAILESVYEKEPNNSVVNNLLRNCYNQLGEYAKVEILVRRQMERAPSAYIYHVYLAEALARQGFTDSAYAQYQDATRYIVNDKIEEYKVVINSMLAHSFTGETVALIDEIRQRKNDQTLFAYEAGVMLETDRDYVAATKQYLIALDDTTTRNAPMAENKLLSLLMFDETFDIVEQVLKSQTAKLPQARAARVLSNAYLNRNQLEKAFEYALLRDSFDGSQGTGLLQFLRSCIDTRQYDLAARMAKEILKRHANSPIYSQTYFLYADVLVKLGQYDKAISIYDSVIARFPRAVDRIQAAVEIGYIYLNNTREYDLALSVFDSVLAAKGLGGPYLRAMMGAPHAYLRKGELDSAKVRFMALQSKRLPPDAVEEVRYFLAEINFLQHDIDSSLAGLNRLLVDYPRGLYINDALELLLLIEDIADDSTLLDLFIDVRRYQRMFMTDSTMSSLKKAAEADHPDLSSMALFRLAEISVDLFDTVKALEFTNQLTEDYKESYYYPYGLKLKAEILLSNPENRTKGQDIYRELLEKYPNYPFTSDVRKRLRQLEQDSRIG